MSVGISVAAGVHVDLERQRLLGTSDGEPVRGAGASDVPSASASETWTSSREKASTSSSSTRIKLAASVVAGVCCVLGVAALGGGGLGARGAVRLSGLGDLLDAGFGRDPTPEEQAQKNALERSAAARSAAALGDSFALDDDDASERDEEAGVDGLPLAGRLGSAALGADGAPIVLARTGALNEPVLENARHDLTHVASKLGAWGDCPRAFRKPRVGVKRDWSAAYTQALSLAEQVYVLCVRCDTFVVPDLLGGKTILVDGRVFDECDQADKYGLDHYKRASLSHAAAVADAVNKKFKSVAVVEEDSVTPMKGAGFRRASLRDGRVRFEESARRGRLVVRALGVATVHAGDRAAVGVSAAVFVRDARREAVLAGGLGCDLRSSDSYIISHRYFRWTLDQLIQGGTIDYDVLPRAPGTLLALPIFSAQKTLDTPVEHQAAVSELFMNRCLFGEVPDFSREAAGDALLSGGEELRQLDADVSVVVDQSAVFGARRGPAERALRPEERARAMAYAEEPPSE